MLRSIYCSKEEQLKIESLKEALIAHKVEAIEEKLILATILWKSGSTLHINDMLNYFYRMLHSV